jgi:hypothetical protein
MINLPGTESTGFSPLGNILGQIMERLEEPEVVIEISGDDTKEDETWTD